MTDYYLRADGTAANLAAAIGPATNAAACMDETLFNASSFAAGDNIYMSSLGGTFSPLTCTLIGTSTNPISVIGDGSALIQRSTVGQCLTLNTGTEWARFSGFDVENTYAVAGSSTNNDAVRFAGAVGAADDESVIFTNVNVLGNPSGDGFSQASAGSGHIHYINCAADLCGTVNTVATGDQGYTAHAAAQSATLTNCTTNGCNEGLSFVGGSTFVMDGGAITAARGKSLKVDTGSKGILNSVSIEYSTATATHLIDNAGTSTAILNSCNISLTNAAAASGYLTTGNTYLINCNLTFNGANCSIYPTGGSLYMEGCDVIITDSAAYAFRVEGAGKFRCFGNVFTGNGVINKRPMLLNTTSVARVSGNIFKGFSTNYECIWNLDGSHIISNNVFYLSVAAARTGIVVTALKTPVITNNIFYNITTSVSSGSPVLSYNCYYNSSNAGGTGSITTNPLFVDPANGDFRLQCVEDAYAANSPCRDTGINAWSALPPPLGYDGEPMQSKTVSMGAWQHQHGPWHPSNL